MKCEVTNWTNQDGISVSIHMPVSDFSFLSQSRFSELMPALLDLRTSSGNNMSNEVSPYELAEFIAVLLKRELASVSKLKEKK